MQVAYSDWLIAKLMFMLFCIFQEVRMLVGKAFRQTEAILDRCIARTIDRYINGSRNRWIARPVNSWIDELLDP